MALTPSVGIGPRASRDGDASIEPTISRAFAEDVEDASDSIVRLRANRLVAGLDSRPFRPTADQLAWVWGGELAGGETRHSRARIASWRYAELFARHVVQDITVEGGAGAYVRIWLCAHRAFIESVDSADAESVAVETT